MKWGYNEIYRSCLYFDYVMIRPKDKGFSAERRFCSYKVTPTSSVSNARRSTDYALTVTVEVYADQTRISSSI